jgi:H+-transporting ATPase
MGIIPLYDPPREDSKETIAAAREMGIDVKMVTGDQLAIGKEIASQLGMGNHILDASAFGDTRHHEASRLDQSIEKADGFAQVFPEHKFHVVEVLQKLGHIVGMTGDGVNDAPALKKADAGIAVSGATDAARTAADVVLLNSGLSVVIDAVKESRKAFRRMNSYAIYRISETIRILLFMTLSILLFNFYPVTAAMIVLLALLNDGPILAIAFDNVGYSDRPETWNMRLVLGMSTILGVAGVIASFGLFYLGIQIFHLSRELLQTFMFLKLAVAGHLTIFVTRTRGAFWSSKPAASLFWSAIVTKLVATLAAVYGWYMAPIGWMWGLLIWGYALVFFLVNDRIKMAAYRILDPHQSLLNSRLHASRKIG